MFGHFPVPHPDETLYSVIARLVARLKVPHERLITEQLFGRRYHRPDLNLPHHLGALAKQIPPEHGITVEEIIQKHTLFPFYAPFLSDDRRQGLENWMNESSMGRYGSAITTETTLKSCRECRDGHERAHGEAYWRRAHQIPGVIVCHIHGTPLVAQPNSNYETADGAEFAEGDSAIENTTPTHLRYAEQSARLLTVTNPPSFTSLIQAFREQLKKEQLTRSRGGKETIRHEELLRRMTGRYDHATIRHFFINPQASTAARHLAWALSFEQPTPRPPQIYFLVADALNTTLPELIEAARQTRRPKALIYACRNPVSLCRGKPTITGYTRSRNIGLFRCPNCGFAYCEATGELNTTRRLKISEVGPVWRARLKQLWRGKSNSLQKIARELGVGTPRVLAEAFRAGLPPIKRAGFSGKFGKSVKALSTQREERRDKHRKLWLDTRRRYPHRNRTELTKLLPGTRGWLDKNDHIWFRAHLPKTAKRPGRQKKGNSASGSRSKQIRQMSAGASCSR